MLCTKINIYTHPPVDTGGQWCQNFNKNKFYLSLKFFHRFPLVRSVLEFQMQSGAPKPRSISFFWPFSINTWSFAPENACGAKHFTLGVILGRPRGNIQSRETLFWIVIKMCTCVAFTSWESKKKKNSPDHQQQNQTAAMSF